MFAVNIFNLFSLQGPILLPKAWLMFYAYV